MFKALLKKQLREVMSTFTAGGKNKSKKKKAMGTAGFVVLFVFLFLSLALAFGGMSFLFADSMLPLGLDWLFFALMGIVGLVISVVGSVFTTYSMLYKAKDNEMLLAMPIPPKTILSVRMLGVFLLNFVFELTALGPAMLVYFIKKGMEAKTLISCLLMLLVMGMVILVLCCVLGWVVALISAKLKNKSVITALISLTLMGAYYIFYFRLSETLQDLAANAIQTGETIKNSAYVFYIFGNACTGDLKSLLLFTAGAAVLFFITLKVLSANFIKIATTGDSSGKKISKDAANIMVYSAASKTSSVKKTLVKRELKHFVSSATYMLNAGLGSVFMLAAAVLLVVKSADIRILVETFSLLGPVAKILPAAAAGVILTITSMNTLTAPSISLEGKSLWIVRSMPLPARDVLASKLYAHLVITLPPALLMTAVACWVLGFDASLWIQLLLFTVLAVLAEALAGLALNLKMPKLDWTVEAVPVKQSAPVVIMIFAGMVLTLVLGFAYYKLFNTAFAAYFLPILVGVFALIDGGLALWTLKKGTRLFEEL